jgi:HPt (histidine-containing phosphotransfer) domain-containing protein
MNIERPALAELKSLIGGDNESLKELIDSFIEEAPELEAGLRKGVNDINVLARAAHSLKSSAHDFGAMDLAQKCANLEEQCKTSTQHDVEAQITDILSELEVALAELKNIDVADI